MPYQQSCIRATPGCILFLLDQSYSMVEGIARSPRPKIDALASAINRFLSELIIRCERGPGEPRHYFDVGVIGYTTTRPTAPGGKPENLIGPVLQGALAGKPLVSVPELFNNPLAIESKPQDDGNGGIKMVKQPIWYRRPENDAMGGTPMGEALEYVYPIVRDWCASHPDSFPPIIVHLTDGEPTGTASPEQAADALRALSTSDGNVLLFNCHLSDSQEPGVIFPAAESELGNNEFSRLLFRMSSEMPEIMRGQAEAFGLRLRPGARGMVFNADGVQMIMFIQVGTKPSDAGDRPSEVEPEAEVLGAADDAEEILEVNEWER